MKILKVVQVLSIFTVGFLSLDAFATNLSENLIKDGGMEEWKETVPQNHSIWGYLVTSKVELDKNDKGNLLTPQILSQFYETKLMRPEEKDVHSGKKAMRLGGQFYLAPSFQDAFKTKDEDIYIVRFWAKGQGKALLYLHVYGSGIAEIIETKGKVENDRWTMIEEHIVISGPSPSTIFPRLVVSAEMLIDDIFIGRVLREDEQKLSPVQPDCQERVAFSSETVEPVVIDGKLNEPAWGQAIPFSGFRSIGDQNFLSAIQPSFRVLFNAEALYFGIEIPLSNASQVLDELQCQPFLDKDGKPLPKNDTYTSRESIELFLQTPGKGNYIQYVVSIDGYRYDGNGKDALWNGNWKCAVTATNDRWFLEMRIPANDLGVEQIAPTEGWLLNLCCNLISGVCTWSAVGGAFHNPALFGKMVTQDFEKWKTLQPLLRMKKKAEILQASGTIRPLYVERLANADAFLPDTGQNGKTLDWEVVTRAYSQINYTGYTYRCAEEEIRYLNFFQ
jgi:hypothetical protein